MRRISVLLVPLFFVPLLVILLPTAVYAIDHWGGAPTGPTPTQAQTWAAIGVTLGMMGALVLSLTLVFPGTNPVCAFFVAVGSVAAMYLIVEYIFIIAGVWVPQTVPQQILAPILKAAFLTAMVIWGAQCCLNKRARLREALIVAVIPVLVQWLLHWVVSSFVVK